MVVFFSPLLSSLRRYVAIDASVWDQTQGYQMGVRVDTTTLPGGADSRKFCELGADPDLTVCLACG